MYHSITFGNKNTWDDWHLIPSSRPVFNPPKLKENYVDIAGSNWHLDLTESVSGEPTYEGRSGSFEFIVANGYKKWSELFSEIMNYLHGRYMKAVLEDDPGYYYEGRFTVNQWKSDPHNSRIIIDYNVNPFKMEQISSLEEWTWDDFNFENGVIREFKERRVDGTLDCIITGSAMSVTPLFMVASDDGSGMTVTHNGIVYNLPDGDTRVINIVIRQGENRLMFTGKGTVSINYRGGSL